VKAATELMSYGKTVATKVPALSIVKRLSPVHQFKFPAN